MKNKQHKDFIEEGQHRGKHHKRKEQHSEKRGAKTFRRGRAIAFLEMMNLKRSTIKQQLDAPEFQSIKQILIGELKAIDMVINEFSKLFEIHESEAKEPHHTKIEEKETFLDREDVLEDDGKGND